MTLLVLQPRAQALRWWPMLPAQGRDAASPGPAPALPSLPTTSPRLRSRNVTNTGRGRDGGNDRRVVQDRDGPSGKRRRKQREGARPGPGAGWGVGTGRHSPTTRDLQAREGDGQRPAACAVPGKRTARTGFTCARSALERRAQFTTGADQLVGFFKYGSYSKC